MRAIYDYIIYTDGGCECNPVVEVDMGLLS